MNKCKWAQGDFEEICVNADCPMCADFCPVLVQPGVCRYEDRGKRTYGDKIRAMTNEEIADMMMSHGQKLFNCEICGELENCIANRRAYTKDNIMYLHCRQKHLDWLKQEVSDNG